VRTTFLFPHTEKRTQRSNTTSDGNATPGTASRQRQISFHIQNADLAKRALLLVKPDEKTEGITTAFLDGGW
jgi:hypothetical protein